MGSCKFKSQLKTFLLWGIRAQSPANQSKTKLQRSNIGDPLTIFWALPRGLHHFLGSTLCRTHSLSSKLTQAPLHHYCYSWWSSLILTSPKHCDLLVKFASTLCRASNSIHDPFKPMPSITSGAESSPTASCDLSQCQNPVILNDPFMTSKPVLSAWILH